MKTFGFTSMIVLSVFSSIGVSSAQNVKDKATLYNTEQFAITSKYVENDKYLIQVGLPIGYSTSAKSYPVFYFTDGDVAFGMIKEIADFLMIGKEIKDIIVVGISYGQGLETWTKKRTRDLKPTSDTIFAKGENVGGADNFLKFIQYELFPVINSNYRTNPDSSSIGGHSLGGLLNSYILFKQPELFKNYVIGSPTLSWDNSNILKLETEYFRKHIELNCTVYIYYGSLENNNYTNPINEFIQNIQTHNYKGMRLVTRIFEGETHLSVLSVAMTNGLKTIFKR